MLIELFKSLKRHQFFTLSTGVFASQLLGFAFMPLLTRLYPVESFGYFAVYLAASNLIGMFSTLRFECTIPIAQDEAEADLLSSVTCLLPLGVGIVVAILFAFSGFRALMPSMSQDWFTWFLIALGAILTGWTQIFTQRIVRNGNLKATALRYILDKVIFIAGSFSAFWLGYASNGMILAQSLATAIGALVLFGGSPWVPRLNLRAAKESARKYSDFPRLTASLALNTLSSQLPTLVYSGFFSAAAIGYMNLAQRLADAPTTIIASALGTVYNRRILNAPRSHLPRIFRRTFLWSVLGLYLPALVVCVFAGPIFRILFGAKWEPSVPFFWVIVPFTLSRMSYCLQQSLTVVLRRLDIDLWSSALVMACQCVGMIVGLKFFTELLAPVATASLLTAGGYFFSVFMLYRIARQCGAQSGVKVDANSPALTSPGPIP